jgi:hypothetical protein
MTDDIVTQLQERIPYAIHPHVLAEAKLLSDAVKEIERLRRELSKWATDVPNRLVCTTHGYQHIYHYGFSDGFECSLCKEGI